MLSFFRRRAKMGLGLQPSAALPAECVAGLGYGAAARTDMIARSFGQFGGKRIDLRVQPINYLQLLEQNAGIRGSADMGGVDQFSNAAQLRADLRLEIHEPDIHFAD